MTHARRGPLSFALAVPMSLCLAAAASAQIMLHATLTTQQETATLDPSTNPSAGAQGTFTFDDESKTLHYQITMVHDLTGPVTAAHIHPGLPGQSGSPLIFLDVATLMGDTRALTDAEAQTLFDGGFYVNLHTTLNPAGEIRGQVTLVQGSCNCETVKNFGQFRSCVAKAIKGLAKAERKDDAIKALKKAVKKSSCGKKHGPKKAIACCLPQHPEHNIVSGHLCAPVSASACTKLGGTSGGASCFPTNPCQPPASPSGAFLGDGDSLL